MQWIETSERLPVIHMETVPGSGYGSSNTLCLIRVHYDHDSPPEYRVGTYYRFPDREGFSVDDYGIRIGFVTDWCEIIGPEGV